MNNTKTLNDLSKAELIKEMNVLKQALALPALTEASKHLLEDMIYCAKHVLMSRQEERA